MGVSFTAFYSDVRPCQWRHWQHDRSLHAPTHAAHANLLCSMDEKRRVFVLSDFICFGRAGFYRLVSCAAKHGMIVPTFYFAAVIARHTPKKKKRPWLGPCFAPPCANAQYNLILRFCLNMMTQWENPWAKYI